jgi:hypothetical protein
LLFCKSDLTVAIYTIICFDCGFIGNSTPSSDMVSWEVLFHLLWGICMFHGSLLTVEDLLTWSSFVPGWHIRPLHPPLAAASLLSVSQVMSPIYTSFSTNGLHGPYRQTTVTCLKLGLKPRLSWIENNTIRNTLVGR